MAVVDRCVCRGVTFAELKDLADRTGADLAEITAKTGCGGSCCTCIPYIEKMLATGETVFEVMPAPVRKWWFSKV